MLYAHSLKAERLGLALLALLLVGAGVGWREPLNVDEERFLGVALEMIQSGHWLVPHRAAEIYPDKPPLFMWAVAALTWLTGWPKVALYLPGLASAVVASLSLHDLGRRLWGLRAGRIAALLFLATYQTFSILRTGQIDSFLCLWVALAVYGLLRHLLLGPAWGWFYVGCAAMGLGIITKGVGFVPGLMLLPYALAVRWQWPGVARMPGQARRWWLGLAVLLGACLLWLLPVVLATLLQGSDEQWAYLRNILFKQTADRYADAWEHREPVWYFFTDVIPHYWLPLVLALPWLVPAWRKQLRKRDGRVLVLLGGLLLTLLFFSLSTGKRKLYIYPALPELVLLATPLLPWLLQRWFAGKARARRVFTVVVVAWFGLWFARGLVEPFIEGENPHEALMADAAEHSEGRELVLVEWREGHWLYARQPLLHFGFMGGRSNVANAAAWLQAHPEARALVPAHSLEQCFVLSKARALGQTSRADWYLVGPDADNGQCRGALPAPVYRFSWVAPPLAGG
ncbi:glycosyltransferase family 39 protein [Pseudomonas sp. NPDC007930]|uniref:ArnT family glycosyltransferase n=1 Tax=Pseudomonas sp. NPDC007930 TaxID=3364417 RepID=UPI0036E44101